MPKRGNVHQSARVLVIDDDEIALEAIREVLVNAGYEVHCLASPIGATQVIVNLGIEAVVVDLNMPVMRGDRFISLLRSWDRICDLPTVLVSGSSAETLENVAANMPGVLTVTKDSMQRALPQALARGLAKEKGQAASNRRAAELNHDERRIIASAAKEGLTALLDKVSDREASWDHLLSHVRVLRERIQRSGLPQLSKASLKLVELVERCAARRQFPPEMRLAARGALELIANLEEPNTAANLPALTAMHTARLERALEELSK
jgi:two-component system chemotaxis response regulator CheY